MAQARSRSLRTYIRVLKIKIARHNPIDDFESILIDWCVLSRRFVDYDNDNFKYESKKIERRRVYGRLLLLSSTTMCSFRFLSPCIIDNQRWDDLHFWP